MNGYLKNTNFYLGGPIEHGLEIDWRSDPKRILTEEFGINVFDPFCDPKQQWATKLYEAKEREDWETVAKIAKRFVHKDLTIVDRMDAIISFLPHKLPTTGTVHEIINADERKKPTLLVCLEGKKNIPAWYFGIVRHEYMFGSWDEVYAYLKRVDAGECTDDERWDLVYGRI